MARKRKPQRKRWSRGDERVKLVNILGKGIEERESILQHWVNEGWRVEAMSDVEVCLLNYPQDTCTLCKEVDDDCKCGECTECKKLFPEEDMVPSYPGGEYERLCIECGDKTLEFFRDELTKAKTQRGLRKRARKVRRVDKLKNLIYSYENHSNREWRKDTTALREEREQLIAELEGVSH